MTELRRSTVEEQMQIDNCNSSVLSIAEAYLEAGVHPQLIHMGILSAAAYFFREQTTECADDLKREDFCAQAKECFNNVALRLAVVEADMAAKEGKVS